MGNFMQKIIEIVDYQENQGVVPMIFVLHKFFQSSKAIWDLEFMSVRPFFLRTYLFCQEKYVCKRQKSFYAFAFACVFSFCCEEEGFRAQEEFQAVAFVIVAMTV